MGVSSHFHAPAALPWGKSLRYPFDMRIGGAQSRSERCEEKFFHYRELNPGRPARSPSLYQLSYPGSSYNEDVGKFDSTHGDTLICTGSVMDFHLSISICYK
jgi:hypothetical protein